MTVILPHRNFYPSVCGVFGLIFILSACSSISVPLDKYFAKEGTNLTPEHAMMQKAAHTADLTNSDFVALDTAISDAMVSVGDLDEMTWLNKKTGANGVINPRAAKMSADGQLCREFYSTINSISGLQRYSGSSCREINGHWRLESFAPDVPRRESDA